jgi:uracil-DNA glycosylase
MIENLDTKWSNLLKEEFQKDYFIELSQKINEERVDQVVYPSHDQVFSAFNLTDFDQVKVVILGQDPYHGPNQAHGLAFSVKKGVKTPPSLRNIFKEIQNEYKCDIPDHGNLEDWAKQGVLLLNSTLTVRESEPNSHSNFGWNLFTDRVIEILSQKKKNLVFILWGANAISKENLIDQSRHLILKSVHPSPLSASRGFFGNDHFKKCNAFLEKVNLNPINWQIQGNPKLFF